jgi:hypothetical protein
VGGPLRELADGRWRTYTAANAEPKGIAWSFEMAPDV